MSTNPENLAKIGPVDSEIDEDGPLKIKKEETEAKHIARQCKHVCTVQ